MKKKWMLVGMLSVLFFLSTFSWADDPDVESVALPLAPIVLAEAVVTPPPSSVSTEVNVTPVVEGLNNTGSALVDGNWIKGGYNPDLYNQVRDRMKRYLTAKNQGDWNAAAAYATTTYARGWMLINKARALKNASWATMDKLGLQQAINLYTDALLAGEEAIKVIDPRGQNFTVSSVDNGMAIISQAKQNIAEIQSVLLNSK
jgi:hypothetical protein